MPHTHTPGPWHVGCGRANKIIFADSGYAVANACVMHPHHGGDDAARANARLIAAAPDLLAFAEKVARICNGDEVGNPLMLLQAFGDEARAAIAKAGGQ